MALPLCGATCMVTRRHDIKAVAKRNGDLPFRTKTNVGAQKCPNIRIRTNVRLRSNIRYFTEYSAILTNI